MRLVIEALERQLRIEQMAIMANKMEKESVRTLPGYKGSPLHPERPEYIKELEEAIKRLSESSSPSHNDIVQEMEKAMAHSKKMVKSAKTDTNAQYYHLAKYDALEEYLPKLKQIGEGSESQESILSRLYEEVKHGDQEHQDWLKSKFDDFLKRLK